MKIKTQRVFSRKDYEGLTEEGKAIMKEKRNDLAKQYKKRLSEINKEATEKLENIKAVYEKGSKQYERAVEKLKKDTQNLIKDELGTLNEAKNKTKGSIPYSRKKPGPDLGGFINSFSKEKANLKTKLKRVGQKIKKTVEKNKKAALIGTGVVGTAGLAAGAVAITKKAKEKKAAGDIRKKVAGDDNKKK